MTCVSGYVSSAPLARAVVVWAPLLGGEATLARDAGVAPKSLRELCGGERRHVMWGTADKVLQALGLGWWEVFDPELAPVGSVERAEWLAACAVAERLWGCSRAGRCPGGARCCLATDLDGSVRGVVGDATA